MKKLLISTAALGLLALTVPALAQHDDHHDGGPGGGHPGPAMAGPRPGGDHGHSGPAMAGPRPAAPRAMEDHHPSAGQQAAPFARPAPAQAMHGNVSPGQRPGPAMAGPRPGNDHDRNDNDHGRGNDRGRNNFDGRNDFGRPGMAPGHNNFGRPGMAPGHRDFSSYHRNFNAPRRFHGPNYSRPRGWYARRWTFGDILPSLFWAPNYWLNDYDNYGLMSPPPGTVWVRDGSDALLIDRISGEIIQVEYDVFY